MSDAVQFLAVVAIGYVAAAVALGVSVIILALMAHWLE